VGLVLLGYLVKWRDVNGPGNGCTAFHLAHKVPGLRTQRQERVQDILRLLEISKLVRSTVSDRVTIYEATDEGGKWYSEVGVRFYSVFESLYKKSELV
jgi:hypothetical protein